MIFNFDIYDDKVRKTMKLNHIHSSRTFLAMS